MIRLYGPKVGWSSFAVVTKGMEAGLAEHDMLSGVLATDGYDEYRPPPGATAPAAILCGHPGELANLIRRGSHAYRSFMLAPNSSWIPGTILNECSKCCTEILTPSCWGKEMIELNMQQDDKWKLPVRVVPHGIMPGYDIGSDPDGPFTILHLASTGLMRKSTHELVKAFQMWKSRKRTDARLILVLSELSFEVVKHRFGWKSLPRDIHLVTRLNKGPDGIGQAYRASHLIVQPSRSEGFGMVPLEALACGVPVAVTTCTGHSEWCREGGGLLPGLVPIENGPDAWIDDAPPGMGSEAPTVEPEAIAAALDWGHFNWIELRKAALANAAKVRSEWSWGKQLAPLVEHIRGIQ